MVVVSDIRMPGMDGIALLSQIRALQPNLPVIITTAHSDLDSAVNSYEEGAFEYLPKPFDIDEMVATVARAQAQHAGKPSSTEATQGQRTTEIIGNAPAMQEVFRAIGRLGAKPYYCADQWRIWYRERAGCARTAPSQPQSEQRLCCVEHGCHSPGTDGVGAIRPRERRVHGCQQSSGRPIRAGSRWYVIPRRNRRHAGRYANSLAARTTRRGVLPGRVALIPSRPM